jgi:DNA mismatch repair protein MutH
VIPRPPADQAELLERAETLAGRSLGELAAALDAGPVPADLHRKKGWIGRLVELALGASAGNRPQPDFESLGVELKTIPVDARGVPRESTFVTTVALLEMGGVRWEDSAPRKKLARVLWIPVDARPSRDGQRRIGRPTVWTPSPTEDAALRDDWEDFAELIANGWVELITAHRGRVLQIRPKAANARERTWTTDPEGGLVETLPRGFYLRRSFTAAILRPPPPTTPLGPVRPPSR